VLHVDPAGQKQVADNNLGYVDKHGLSINGPEQLLLPEQVKAPLSDEIEEALLPLVTGVVVPVPPQGTHLYVESD
jgi:hypothetical protein